MPMIQQTPPSQKGRRVLNIRSPRIDLAITDELIARSVKRDSSHCMIAEAVKLAFPGARRVSVDLQTIRFSDPVRPIRYTYLTPRRAQVALVNFDQGSKVEPFNVQLRSGAVTARPSKNAPKAPKAPKPDDQVQVVVKPSVPRKKTILPQRSGNPKTAVPEIAGGRTPPRAPLSSDSVRGRRRQFGLRALDA